MILSQRYSHMGRHQSSTSMTGNYNVHKPTHTSQMTFSNKLTQTALIYLFLTVLSSSSKLTEIDPIFHIMHTGIFNQNMSSDPKDKVLQIHYYSYTFVDTKNCILGQTLKSIISVFCPLNVKHKTKPTYVLNKHNKKH
jgi:hypothetical protein